MELKEMCLQGLAKTLNQNIPKLFSTPGEEGYWKFSLRITEIIRKSLTEEIMNSSLIFFFAVLFPAFLQSASEFEGYSEIHCEPEKKLIDELLTFNPLSYPHEFFIKIFERKLLDQISFESPSLDLGIGTGDASAFIFNNRKLTVGSDPSIELLLKSQKFSLYENYTTIDMTCIPYADQSFKSVFAFNSFYHCENKKSALREMARTLAPGGLLVFNDSFKARMYSSFPKLLESFGFKKLKAARDDSRYSLNGKSDSFSDPSWIKEELLTLGFEAIEVFPFYARPLAELGEFFQEFQGAFMVNSLKIFESKGQETLFKAWQEFLYQVLAPMIAKDKDFCSELGESGYITFTARKKKNANCSSPPLDFTCPQCKTILNKIKNCYVCDRCGLDYPIVEGIPLLIPFYAEAYSR